MSPSATDREAWKRLGDLLTRRRVELDPRYQNRTTFSAERGLDYRLAYDIEEARRSNFRTTTLTAIAAAYAVTAESVFAVLRDGATRLAPAPGSSPVTRPRLTPVPPEPAPSPRRPPAEDGSDEFLEKLVAQYPESGEVLRGIWQLPDSEGRLMAREERVKLALAWIHGSAPSERQRREETG